MPNVPEVPSLSIPLSQKGAKSGVATLDATGKVPGAELPASTGEVFGPWLKPEAINAKLEQSSVSPCEARLELNETKVSFRGELWVKTGELFNPGAQENPPIGVFEVAFKVPAGLRPSATRSPASVEIQDGGHFEILTNGNVLWATFGSKLFGPTAEEAANGIRTYLYFEGLSFYL